MSKKKKKFRKKSSFGSRHVTHYILLQFKEKTFFLENTMILGGKLGNPWWIWSEDLFFFSDHLLSYTKNCFSYLFFRTLNSSPPYFSCTGPQFCKASLPTWSRFKTHSRHSVVFLRKTLYGTFPCLLVILASSSKLQTYLFKLQADSNMLASP